jgi:hypothetical protein
LGVQASLHWFKVAGLASKTPLATANDRLSRAGCRVTD